MYAYIIILTSALSGLLHHPRAVVGTSKHSDAGSQNIIQGAVPASQHRTSASGTSFPVIILPSHSPRDVCVTRAQFYSSAYPTSDDIFAFSMMHFPSLYFWLSSNASTCECGKRGQNPGNQNGEGFPKRLKISRGCAAHVFPTQDGLARVAVDVGDGVEPGDEHAVLLGAQSNVHAVRGTEEKLDQREKMRPWRGKQDCSEPPLCEVHACCGVESRSERILHGPPLLSNSLSWQTHTSLKRKACPCLP